MLPTAAVSNLDLAFLVILLGSAVLGLWRGLVFELISLATWLLSWAVAWWWGPAVGARLLPGSPGLSAALGYLACFVATLVVGALLARLFRMMVAATPLQWIDRLLGGAFGVLRGGLILVAVVSLVSLTPVARWPSWQSSVTAQWLGGWTTRAQAWWPRGPAA